MAIDENAKAPEVRVLGLTISGQETSGELAVAIGELGCASSAVVASCEAAMELVSDLSRRPQVAVIDLAAVGGTSDVFGLAARLKDGFSIPVLFAMSRSDLGHMNSAIAARPAGYLHKPFEAQALQKAVTELVPPKPKVAPRPQAVLPPKLDLSKLAGPVPVSQTETDSGRSSDLGSHSAPMQPLSLAASGAKESTAPVITKLRAPEPDMPNPSPPATTPLPSEEKQTALEDWQRAMRGQQLQGLGFLGRGFAHEFNNLLTVLIGNLSLAQDRFEPAETADSDSELAIAQKAAERARRMVQQLLTFAEGGRPVRESVRIADLARAVLMTHRESQPKARFQFQCSEPDLRVSVDRDQISRLLENLVFNGLQAMPGGGTLIVRLFTATDTEIDRIRPGAGQSGLEYLLIEVIDTGIGMDEDTLRRAFDPYFTTRGDVNATGIGLTVCESIAKAHGGFLVLQSKPGRGTIATFHLPMNAATARPDIFEMREDSGESIPGLFSESEPDAGARSDDRFGSAGGNGFGATASSTSPLTDTPGGGPDQDEYANVGAGLRVLVMEDDAMIRRLVSRCLGRAGYDIVETTNGQDALDMHGMAIAEGRAFDLILSDLTIEEGMGGIEMMRELRQRDPSIRAIVSSGYADSPAMAAPREYGFDAVLPKPYPPRELLRVVGETAGVAAKGVA